LIVCEKTHDGDVQIYASSVTAWRSGEKLTEKNVEYPEKKGNGEWMGNGDVRCASIMILLSFPSVPSLKGNLIMVASFFEKKSQTRR
jgi:hypothetical protein